jgi:hypothetical protein
MTDIQIFTIFCQLLTMVGVGWMYYTNVRWSRAYRKLYEEKVELEVRLKAAIESSDAMYDCIIRNAEQVLAVIQRANKV